MISPCMICFLIDSFNFYLMCDSILLFSTFCIILHIIFDVPGNPSNIGLFYLVFGIPFTYITTMLVVDYKELYYIRRGFRLISNEF